jgi:hypothetical protein
LTHIVTYQNPGGRIRAENNPDGKGATLRPHCHCLYPFMPLAITVLRLRHSTFQYWQKKEIVIFIWEISKLPVES